MAHKSEKVGQSDISNKSTLAFDLKCLGTKFEVILSFSYETCPCSWRNRLTNNKRAKPYCITSADLKVTAELNMAISNINTEFNG